MEVITYPCVNCGADLIFRAEKQGFHCRYCDSEFTSEQIAEIYPKKEFHPLDIEEENKNPEEESNFTEQSSLYSCPDCGANIITDNTTSATLCFYCHSPVILAGRLSGEHKPSKLIPFRITEKAAREMLEKYCNRRWFLPRGFNTEANLSLMKSIYIPYWIATCATGGRITANGKIIRTWRQGDYLYTETREYAIIREGDMIFEKIPADASVKANDVLMENIEPFDYKELKDFRMSYLSGFFAEKYEVAKENVFPRIKQRAIATAESELKSTINGYNSINVINSTVDVHKVRWDQYLLPVWFLSYTYKDRIYHYAINGQTGKFSGNLPIVWWKVIIACLISTVFIIGLSLLGGLLL